MALSPRFALNSFAVLAGGFLAVSAMTFTAPVAGWLGFGVSTAVALAGVAGLVLAHRTSAKAGHGVLAAVGLWSLVASLVFTGGALTWLVFAGGAAFAAVALADLTAHELSTERVVHSLEVRPADTTANNTALPHNVAA
ncbi:hypothetical protein [Streptomyces sp. 8L]|uniref:hypothetical protein n=1 Tax=Streptomyces sp. 8L TaxID=2877242 RepID=UPI001CD71A59|nr:hypothetical protein [Streptomyces sp. 8L]MCA1218148.1 hypothetical protein [Streptomyces sp. 8L]